MQNTAQIVGGLRARVSMAALTLASLALSAGIAAAQGEGSVDIAPITDAIDTGKGYVQTIGAAAFTVLAIFVLFKMARRGVSKLT